MMEESSKRFKFSEDAVIALLLKLSKTSKVDYPSQQAYGGQTKALQKLADECKLLPGLEGAPASTLQSKLKGLSLFTLYLASK